MKRPYQIFASSFLLLNLFSPTVSAHNIKTNGDVGVTFHIEPDHNPRVGEKSQAWFALTRQGGELISLSQCDCQLNVYLESGNNPVSNTPLLTPTLIAISPEKYQNIPGANIIFPQPGIYQLQLTGKATQEGDFNSFEVTYPVTVQPQVNSSVPEKPNTTSNQEQANNNNQAETAKSFSIYPWLIGIVIVALGFITVQKFSK